MGPMLTGGLLGHCGPFSGESLPYLKSAMNAIEPVYMELVDFVARGVTPEDVANFRPSVEAQMRVADLLEKQRE